MATDRRSYDTGASQEVQGDLHGIIARLEAVISQRSSDVQAAMSDFHADGVSAEYQAAEHKWNQAANEVRQIIHLVQTTLARNDETATTTMSRARSAVQGI